MRREAEGSASATPGAVAPAASSAPEQPSWHARLLLLRPRRVRDHLADRLAKKLIPAAPTLWQIELGVLRMWHRVFFRAGTIGTARHARPRRTLRARLLRFRPFRAPFLIAEQAVAPLDHSGLVQPSERMIRHLLGAYHDENAFAYDLEILRADAAALARLRVLAESVVDGTHPRAAWLRDLVVFEGYHESLLDAVRCAESGNLRLTGAERDDPDVSFGA
jgi:hypothetical protein